MGLTLQGSRGILPMTLKYWIWKDHLKFFPQKWQNCAGIWAPQQWAELVSWAVQVTQRQLTTQVNLPPAAHSHPKSHSGTVFLGILTVAQKFMWGRKKFSSMFKVLLADLIRKSAQNRLTGESNRISLHTYVWEPHIHKGFRDEVDIWHSELRMR